MGFDETFVNGKKRTDIYHFTTRKLLQKCMDEFVLDIILVIFLQGIDLILFFVILKID